MSTALNELTAVLDQAKAAAAQVQTPAVYQPQASAPVAPARPVSMMEMLAEGGMSVKAYMKVDKPGFTIGSDTSVYHKEFPVEFRLGDAKPFYGIRYGNPAKYLRSIDRVTETRSRRPWTAALEEAQRLDPKCKGDYRAVEIPFTVLADIQDDKKKVLVEAGEAIGWTSSITNWKPFEEFIKPYFVQLGAGQITEDTILRGKIVHQQGKSDANVWGLVTFADFTAV